MDRARTRGAPPWRIHALVITLATVAAFLAAAPHASATSMHCDSGICYWGYNNVGPVVNWQVVGTWNYWLDQYIDKTNGGTIAHGFSVPNPGPNPSCWEYMSGVWTFYETPSTIGNGCGGYLQPWIQYFSGNTTYLYTYSVS